ncbi:MAG: hypothetical protein AB8I08_20230, partial [Sandaracinaceae bacterium]
VMRIDERDPAGVRRDESMRCIGEEGRAAAGPAPAAEARGDLRRGHRLTEAEVVMRIDERARVPLGCAA